MARWLWFLTALFVTVAIPGVARAGYTHYWTWRSPPPPEELDACMREMEAIVDSRRDILADRDDKSGAAAVFAGVRDGGASRVLFFNGTGAQAHEPFVFPGQLGFNFTKTMTTSYKKYDEVVTACLIVARDHFPPGVLEIASDGSWAQGDWAAGALLYTAVLKRPAENPVRPFILQGSSLAASVSSGSGRVSASSDARESIDDEGPTASSAITRNWMLSGAMALVGVFALLVTWVRRRWL